jgi:hypothetical protein
VKYGTMRECALPGGSHRRWRNCQNCRHEMSLKKSSAGLNLTNMFVGSERTLGIITSVRLKMHAPPLNMAVAMIAFPGVAEAVEPVVQVMQCDLSVTRIAFLDQPGVRVFYEDSKLANLDSNLPMLFVELHALSIHAHNQACTRCKEHIQLRQSFQGRTNQGALTSHPARGRHKGALLWTKLITTLACCKKVFLFSSSISSSARSKWLNAQILLMRPNRCTVARDISGSALGNPSALMPSNGPEVRPRRID